MVPIQDDNKLAVQTQVKPLLDYTCNKLIPERTTHTKRLKKEEMIEFVFLRRKVIFLHNMKVISSLKVLIHFD